MNLVVLTLPDESAELAPWLERQLLSPDLGKLVAELTAVHGDLPTPNLDDWLDHHRFALMQHGLSALPRERLRELMRSPGLLLELQELVLIEGGDYWTRQLNGEPIAETLATSGPQRRRSFLTHPLVVALYTAACVAAFFLFTDFGQFFRNEPIQTVARPVGWNQEDAFTPEPTPAAYLEKVAVRAEEFKTVGGESPEQLVARISAFRLGCARFQLAAHDQLPPEMREDLRTRCRNWSNELDRHLAALEADPAKSAEIGRAVDALLTKLAGFLRERARQLPAA